MGHVLTPCCCDCHGPLDKSARGLRCVYCWIEHVRLYNPEAADALAAQFLPPVQLSLWEEENKGESIDG